MSYAKYFEDRADQIREDRLRDTKDQLKFYGVLNPDEWEIKLTQWDCQARYRFDVGMFSEFEARYLGNGRFRLLQYNKTGTAMLRDWTGDWDHLTLVIDELLKQQLHN